MSQGWMFTGKLPYIACQPKILLHSLQPNEKISLLKKSNLKPVEYTLPRGTRGIRNPLLGECLWPWFCAKQARNYGPPPVE